MRGRLQRDARVERDGPVRLLGEAGDFKERALIGLNHDVRAAEHEVTAGGGESGGLPAQMLKQRVNLLRILQNGLTGGGDLRSHGAALKKLYAQLLFQ